MAGEPSGESFLLGPDLPLPARAGEPSGESFLLGLIRLLGRPRRGAFEQHRVGRAYPRVRTCSFRSRSRVCVPFRFTGRHLFHPVDQRTRLTSIS